MTHRSGRWAGQLGPLDLGSLPCSVSGVRKSPILPKCLSTKFLVFVFLFMRARDDQKTGRNELKHSSSSAACQQKPHTQS